MIVVIGDFPSLQTIELEDHAIKYCQDIMFMSNDW